MAVRLGLSKKIRDVYWYLCFMGSLFSIVSSFSYWKTVSIMSNDDHCHVLDILVITQI